MTLINSIIKRNEYYKDITHEVIEKYKLVFDAAFLAIAKPKLNVHWIGIDLHPNTSKLLIIIGMATYEEGGIIASPDGEAIYIDSTNKNNYNTGIKLILPINLIENYDAEGAEKFIHEYIALGNNISVEEIEMLLSNDKFLKKSFSAFKDIKIEKSKNNVNEYDGFDLNEFDLDDIQIKQLKLGKFGGQS
jgi:hypothetical protein